MPITTPSAIDVDACAEVLATLAGALQAVDVLPQLSEARFLATHKLFEGLSDQRQHIVDTLRARIRPAAPEGRPLRVLGVGCGGGDVDVSLARSLAARVGDVHYVGVDPNRAECGAFVEAFENAAIPGVRLETHPVAFEAFDATEHFDVIHFVHSLYYMPDPVAALARARELLAPGGELVVVQAPREALNQLAALFYDKSFDRPTLFASGIATVLDRWESTVERIRLDAKVEVTDLFGGDAEVRAALTDFIVQIDAQALPEPVQELIQRYLALVAFEHGGRRFIGHPVDAFFVTEGSPRSVG